jgi:hypothetical protein
MPLLWSIPTARRCDKGCLRWPGNPSGRGGAQLVIARDWWYGLGTAVTEIDTVNPFPAIFLGGFGMMATFWLTRSMRASEPVVGVTPTTLPAVVGPSGAAVVVGGCGAAFAAAATMLVPNGPGVP